MVHAFGAFHIQEIFAYIKYFDLCFLLNFFSFHFELIFPIYHHDLFPVYNEKTLLEKLS